MSTSRQSFSVDANIEGRSEPSSSEGEVRFRWNYSSWSTVQFTIAMVTVGLGDLHFWDFARLVKQHGGVAFLAVYAVVMVLAGLPLMYIQVAMAKYSSRGYLCLWNAVPLYRGYLPINDFSPGVGWSSMLLCMWKCVHSSATAAYALVYLHEILSAQLLPNNTCEQWKSDSSVYTDCWNRTSSNYTFSGRNEILKKSSGITDGIVDMNMKTSLYLTLFMSIVFAMLVKSRYAFRMIVMLSFPLSAILMIVLCVRNCSLEEAWSGIAYVLNPRWEELMNLKNTPQCSFWRNRISIFRISAIRRSCRIDYIAIVHLLESFMLLYETWSSACEFIIYSFGIPLGAFHTIASYAPFSGSIAKNCTTIMMLNIAFNAISLLIIGSLFGHFKYSNGLTIDSYLSYGTDLIFVAVPELLSLTNQPIVWITVFFVLLIILLLNGLVLTIETMSTTLLDWISTLSKARIYATLAICASVVILALSMCTKAGLYVYILLEEFGITYAILIISLVHLLAFSWTYDTEKLTSDIELMTGHKPSFYWHIMWILITPLLIEFSIAVKLTGFKYIGGAAELSNSIDEILASDGDGIIVTRWLLMGFSLLPIVLFGVYELKVNGGFSKATESTEKWKPSNGSVSSENYQVTDYVRESTKSLRQCEIAGQTNQNFDEIEL